MGSCALSGGTKHIGGCEAMLAPPAELRTGNGELLSPARRVAVSDADNFQINLKHIHDRLGSDANLK